MTRRRPNGSLLSFPIDSLVQMGYPLTEVGSRGTSHMESYLLRQRDYLLSISRAMTARLDLPSLLHLIIEKAVEMLSGEAGLIALLDRDDHFRLRASYGLPARTPQFLAPLLTDIPLQHAHWPVPDLYARLQLVAASAGISLRQVVGLPLTLDDRLIGVIYVFRTRDTAFSANDRQVLSSFADQAAIAVRNATLYQQVTEEKRRVDAIIENSADGVLILDDKCRIQAINRALAKITGWTPEQARGQPCRRVVALRNSQGRNICETGCPLDAFSQSSKLQVEGDIIRPGGHRTSVSITYSPLYDHEGTLVNIIGSVHDVTRFREAEEMKAMFISVISHELKTPVALIKGYANTLQREDAHWDEETVRESLVIIEEESDRLDRLISNLLEASRIQAGTLKMELSDVSIPRLAAKAIERFRVQATQHELQLDFPPDFPPLLADEERLQEVFSNLISNAIKYSPDGGTIRVGGRAHRDHVELFVSDQGLGIPPDKQSGLFEPFYRVDSSLGRRTQGVGLGLFLCKAIVEGHGGHIWVESAQDKGSTFRFTLPLR
jgi:PAS domain S-box-containing protein